MKQAKIDTMQSWIERATFRTGFMGANHMEVSITIPKPQIEIAVMGLFWWPLDNRTDSDTKLSVVLPIIEYKTRDECEAAGKRQVKIAAVEKWRLNNMDNVLKQRAALAQNLVNRRLQLFFASLLLLWLLF